jgi:hypothetical protein
MGEDIIGKEPLHIVCSQSLHHSRDQSLKYERGGPLFGCGTDQSRTALINRVCSPIAFVGRKFVSRDHACYSVYTLDQDRSAIHAGRHFDAWMFARKRVG